MSSVARGLASPVPPPVPATLRQGGAASGPLAADSTRSASSEGARTTPCDSVANTSGRQLEGKERSNGAAAAAARSPPATKGHPGASSHNSSVGGPMAAAAGAYVHGSESLMPTFRPSLVATPSASCLSSMTTATTATTVSTANSQTTRTTHNGESLLRSPTFADRPLQAMTFARRPSVAPAVHNPLIDDLLGDDMGSASQPAEGPADGNGAATSDGADENNNSQNLLDHYYMTQLGHPANAIAGPAWPGNKAAGANAAGGGGGGHAGSTANTTKDSSTNPTSSLALDAIKQATQSFVNTLRMHELNCFLHGAREDDVGAGAASSTTHRREQSVKELLHGKTQQEVDALVIDLLDILEEIRATNNQLKPLGTSLAELFPDLEVNENGDALGMSMYSTMSTASLMRPPVHETNKIKLKYDPLEKKKIINNYLILANLGRGSYGKVKLGEELTTKRKVAIKIIDKKHLQKKFGGLVAPPADDDDDDDDSRAGGDGNRRRRKSTVVVPGNPTGGGAASAEENALKREIAIMKKVRHRNCVSLFEVIDDPSSQKLYLIMDYVPNGPVVKLKQNKIPIELIKSIEGNSTVNNIVYNRYLIRVCVRQQLLAAKYVEENISSDGCQSASSGPKQNSVPAKAAELTAVDGTTPLTQRELCGRGAGGSMSTGLSKGAKEGEFFLFSCKPVKEEIVFVFLRQLVSGLRYLHKKSVVHHDIKPDNILLGINNHVYLTDFGVSEIFDKGPTTVEAGGAGKSGILNRRESIQPAANGAPRFGGGTLLFTAPELFSDDASALRRLNPFLTDIWALGVTLYCILIGVSPFNGKSYHEIAYSIRHLQLPYNGLNVESTPLATEWETVLRGLLERDPRKRWTLSTLRRFLDTDAGMKKLYAKGSAFALPTTITTSDGIGETLEATDDTALRSPDSPTKTARVPTATALLSPLSPAGSGSPNPSSAHRTFTPSDASATVTPQDGDRMRARSDAGSSRDEGSPLPAGCGVTPTAAASANAEDDECDSLYSGSHARHSSELEFPLTAAERVLDLSAQEIENATRCERVEVLTVFQKRHVVSDATLAIVHDYIAKVRFRVNQRTKNNLQLLPADDGEGNRSPPPPSSSARAQSSVGYIVSGGSNDGSTIVLAPSSSAETFGSVSRAGEAGQSTTDARQPPASSALASSHSPGASTSANVSDISQLPDISTSTAGRVRALRATGRAGGDDSDDSDDDGRRADAAGGELTGSSSGSMTTMMVPVVNVAGGFHRVSAGGETFYVPTSSLAGGATAGRPAGAFGQLSSSVSDVRRFSVSSTTHRDSASVSSSGGARKVTVVCGREGACRETLSPLVGATADDATGAVPPSATSRGGGNVRHGPGRRGSTTILSGDTDDAGGATRPGPGEGQTHHGQPAGAHRRGSTHNHRSSESIGRLDMSTLDAMLSIVNLQSTSCRSNSFSFSSSLNSTKDTTTEHDEAESSRSKSHRTSLSSRTAGGGASPASAGQPQLASVSPRAASRASAEAAPGAARTPMGGASKSSDTDERRGELCNGSGGSGSRSPSRAPAGAGRSAVAALRGATMVAAEDELTFNGVETDGARTGLTGENASSSGDGSDDCGSEQRPPRAGRATLPRKDSVKSAHIHGRANELAQTVRSGADATGDDHSVRPTTAGTTGGLRLTSRPQGRAARGGPRRGGGWRRTSGSSTPSSGASPVAAPLVAKDSNVTAFTERRSGGGRASWRAKLASTVSFRRDSNTSDSRGGNGDSGRHASPRPQPRRMKRTVQTSVVRGGSAGESGMSYLQSVEEYALSSSADTIPYTPTKDGSTATGAGDSAEQNCALNGGELMSAADSLAGGVVPRRPSSEPLRRDRNSTKRGASASKPPLHSGNGGRVGSRESPSHYSSGGPDTQHGRAASGSLVSYEVCSGRGKAAGGARPPTRTNHSTTSSLLDSSFASAPRPELAAKRTPRGSPSPSGRAIVTPPGEGGAARRPTIEEVAASGADAGETATPQAATLLELQQRILSESGRGTLEKGECFTPRASETSVGGKVDADARIAQTLHAWEEVKDGKRYASFIVQKR